MLTFLLVLFPLPETLADPPAPPWAVLLFVLVLVTGPVVALPPVADPPVAVEEDLLEPPVAEELLLAALLDVEAEFEALVDVLEALFAAVVVVGVEGTQINAIPSTTS